MWAATKAARSILAQAKKPRTVLGQMPPTGVAYHAARAAIEAHREALEVTHLCPPEGSGTFPCCGLTPFEAPRTDRMTLDPSLVTCRAETEKT